MIIFKKLGAITMLIQCTRKLLNELKIKEVSHFEQDPLFSWHANVIMTNRRKTVVLVNDQNRYIIVLYGLLAKDFKKLDELILQAIPEVFRAEGIREEVIDQYIEHAPSITFTKTKDRTSIARMNKSIESIYVFGELLESEKIVQPALSCRASRFLVGTGKNDYIYPNGELYKNLEEFVGKPVIQTKAVQIKVTLQLKNFRVWRRLIVPVHLTFRQLHQTLQIAFGWQNYHLHEFYIFDNIESTVDESKSNIYHSAFHRYGKKTIAIIVSDEEELAYGDEIPMKLDTKTLLKEYFPTYQTVKYIYDFGDDWRHDIEVEAFIDDYEKNYPMCLEGEGKTPPEDVGGEHGYEAFLNILADKNHPDHDHMVAWGQSQEYKAFDISDVNLDLNNRFE